MREINGTITNTMALQSSPNKRSKEVYGSSSKVRLLRAPIAGRHKNIPPRQIRFDCLPLIVTQFRIARGLKSIFYRFRNRPHVGI